MNKTTRQAVSIVLKYGEEVFFIKRQNFLKAFPGYTSFPGGKVDRGDREEKLENTLLNTLYREAQEELGVNLKDYLFKNEEESIKQIAKATSPAFNPSRFETYFYLVELKKKVIFDVDENEACEFKWEKPKSIISEFDDGKRLMVGPVRRLIEKLALTPEKDYKNLFLDFDKYEKQKIPSIEPLKNFIQVMPLSNTIFPATRTNSFIIGDREKILVDPSPKNRDELNYFLDEINKYKISKILITHHHKDHHQFVTDVARDLKVPILISRDSQSRIEKIYGNSYFLNIEVKNSKEGDIVTQWLGKDVVVSEIPGHDEGHLGLFPTSLEWFLVGDLFQGIGTVVVGGDEGDMSKYMDSLERVIKLSPMCVIPSHGIALGGTNILQKTLAHRKLREKQIKQLTEQGHSIEGILKIIYFDIPQSVLKYARANIKSHLEKLNKS